MSTLHVKNTGAINTVSYSYKPKIEVCMRFINRNTNLMILVYNYFIARRAKYSVSYLSNCIGLSSTALLTCS